MLGALLSLGIVSSCKNYDDDINSLNNKVTAIESDIANVKKELEDAVNNKIFITDYYENENSNGWILLLSDGKKIEIPASGNKEVAFFQFKTDNGVWKVSTDKGGSWTPVKDGANNEITAKKTDNIKFDETSGKIYIGDKETTVSCDKSNPILAENQLSQTVYIAIGGESYVIKMSGSDYEGISAIIFRKQHVFDKEDYLEASILTNGEKTLVSRPATAQFRILPEDIELTKEDNYQCKDIHQVEPTTRAGEELKIDFKEFKDGLLTLELTPASMEHDLYYGSTLEITVNDATTSSDYFVVHPAIRDLKDAAIFSTADRYPVAGEKVIEFSSVDGIDLTQAFAVGFSTGENGEYKSMDELFTESEMQGIMNAAKYEMAEETTGYAVSAEGKLTADNNAQNACKVTISYTIDGKTISVTQQFLAVIPAEKLVFTGELGDIRPLSKSAHEIPLTQTEGTTATLEALSETVELGTKDENSNYTKLEGVSLSVKEEQLYLVVAAKTDIELTDATLYAIKDGKIANINGGNWEISNVTLHKYEESVTPKKESQYMKDGVIIGRKGSNSKNEGKNGYTFENISVHELYDIIPEDLEVKFEYDASTYLDGKPNNENNKLKNGNTEIDDSSPSNINLKLSWTDDTYTFTIKKRITAKKWQLVVKATSNSTVLNKTTWKFQSPIDVDNMNNFLPHQTAVTYNGKVEQGGTISFADLVKDTWKTRLSIKNLIDGKEWLVYESGLGVYQTDWAKANLLEDGSSQGLYFRIGQINDENYNDKFPNEKKAFRAQEGEKWMNHDYDSKTGIFTCTEYYDPTKTYTLKCGVGYHSDFGTTFFSNNQITIIIPAQE
ncbi:hypothetical protein SAMN05192582_100682 [Bacteroides ovatus]|uniref:DUF4988 domain-containing protein n=2 Tax=Bacteroides ovatus TaxID=28116 RepID=A0A1G8CQ46_BACOV|nr:hypothetical protein SAMN05192582_100682 [Bacteroides ovatus]